MSAMQIALERVYGGDQSLEASAVEDQLEDLGQAVVPVGIVYDLTRPRRSWWPFARQT